MATGPQDDFSAEESIPQGAASLESILCTDELRRRPYRPPDYEKENRALVALATAMVDPKSNILQTFAETILEITQSDSAGLSLLTKDGGNRFYWPAIAGEWKPHAGAGTRVILGLQETCWIAIARCYSGASNGAIPTCGQSRRPRRSA